MPALIPPLSAPFFRACKARFPRLAPVDPPAAAAPAPPSIAPTAAMVTAPESVALSPWLIVYPVVDRAAPMAAAASGEPIPLVATTATTATTITAMVNACAFCCSDQVKRFPYPARLSSHPVVGRRTP